MKKITVLLAVIFSSITLFAQDSVSNKWNVAADVFPFLSKGYSFKIGLTPKVAPKYDLAIEYFSMEIPSSVIDFNEKNKGVGWSEKVNTGLAFYIDRKLSDKRNSFYAGLAVVYLDHTAQNKMEVNNYQQLEGLLRVNYRWYPFSKLNFYLNPYLAVAYRTKVNGEHGSYNLSPFMGFGSVYMSYEF